MIDINDSKHMSNSYNGQKYEYSVETIPADYSPLLSQIPDKPSILYVRGNKELLIQPGATYICIVGSRRFTSYGKEACEVLVKSLKGQDVIVVSGLALGIDGLVHDICVSEGIKCIAVPGSGINDDVLYPRSHQFLAESILNSGGLLLSEFEPSTRASPWSFPLRNRIMAGLSHAVLVIEGEHDSGTLITARMALEYNRDVLALPGSIFSDASLGPLDLIKKGAVPICGPTDLHEALGLKVDKLLFDAPDESLTYNSSTDDELVILRLLNEPRGRDFLHKESQLDFTKIQILISILEIKNMIKEEFGMISLTEKGRVIMRKLKQ